MSDTIRIAMWSGPRNISTAMMRSWESRADCHVMDEPFYGAYLASTGLNHPMADEIMKAHPTGWDEIAAACAEAATAPIVYQKHMCQHMIEEAPLDWMRELRHAFLIRPPAEVAASFKEKWDGVGEEHLGFRRQAELFDHVCELTGSEPPVVEARDVLENPEGLLRALCRDLEVSYDPAMLTWRAGARSSDGIWACHWYQAVNASTGFGAPKKPATLPEELAPIVDASEPFYQRLARRKLAPAADCGPNS